MFVVPSQNLWVDRLHWKGRWERSGSLYTQEREAIRDRNCLPWVIHDEQTSGFWGVGNCNEGFKSMWAHNGLTNYVCHCPEVISFVLSLLLLIRRYYFTFSSYVIALQSSCVLTVQQGEIKHLCTWFSLFFFWVCIDHGTTKLHSSVNVILSVITHLSPSLVKDWNFKLQ